MWVSKGINQLYFCLGYAMTSYYFFFMKTKVLPWQPKWILQMQPHDRGEVMRWRRVCESSSNRKNTSGGKMNNNKNEINYKIKIMPFRRGRGDGVKSEGWVGATVLIILEVKKIHPHSRTWRTRNQKDSVPLDPRSSLWDLISEICIQCKSYFQRLPPTPKCDHSVLK